MSARVDFFEVVQLADQPALEKARGMKGYILGVSERADPDFAYGVWVYGLERLWSVARDQFTVLGYRDEIAKADHAKSAAIRVSQSGDVL